MNFTEGTPVPIEEVLVEARFAPNRAIRAGVGAIDLGFLGEKAERACDKAQNGGSHLYFLPAIINQDKELHVFDEVDADNVGKIYMLMNERSVMATNILSHTHTVPPIPQSMVDIFLPDGDILSSAATFSVNPAHKILVFRSEQTPIIPFNEINRLSEIWNKAIEEIISRSSDEYKSDFDYIKKVIDTRTGFFQRMITQYNLQAFSCPLRENIARRMVFEGKV